MEKGKNYIQLGEFEAAKGYFEEAVKHDPELYEAQLFLADCYFQLKQWDDAAWYYKLVHDNDPKAPLRVLLQAAESNFNNQNFHDALNQLKTFLLQTGISNSQKERALKLQRDVFFAKDAIRKPVPFEPLNLGPAINSVNHEYLPSLTADGNTLVFTRRIMNQEDLFETYRDDSVWTMAQPIKSINTGDNEGAHAISADGNLLFYTACNRPTGLGSCDIYFSQKLRTGWKPPMGIGRPVNSENWESQPCLSADGRTLFFTSDRAGGMGGNDIWVSYLDANNRWTNPLNMGGGINTAGNDQSPFLHPDGMTLYFSSDGLPGMGGTDLYFVRWDGKKWTAPVNLGYPINTAGNEGSLIVSLDGATGYYASDRPGGMGKLDIYSFKMPEFARPLLTSYVKVQVRDGASGKPIDAGFVFTDLTTGQPVFSNNTRDGEFLACLPAGKNYSLNISKQGYLFYSDNFNLQKATASHPYEYTVTLEPLQKDKTIVLNNIFFATNEYALETASFIELDKVVSLMQQNPAIKAEIRGHTDNTGSDAINYELSQKRAESVVLYLQEKGISKDRLIAKGYGSTIAVASNSTEEGRARNRRTEFRIVE